MDYLRQGIHLRGYAQKNPKQEYKVDAFDMFEQMLNSIKLEVIGIVSKVQVRAEADVEAVEEQRRQQNVPTEFTHASAMELSEAPDAGDSSAIPQLAAAHPFTRAEPKVGRNEACPCGSGKKYKHCHGKLA
jgi:preprotein translocase subunit SecA